MRYNDFGAGLWSNGKVEQRWIFPKTLTRLMWNRAARKWNFLFVLQSGPDNLVNICSRPNEVVRFYTSDEAGLQGSWQRGAMGGLWPLTKLDDIAFVAAL